MKATPSLISLGLGLISLVACKGPELRRINRDQLPVRMAVGLPAGLPERERIESLYTRDLKSALSRSLVLAENGTEAPLITVEVAGRFSRAQITRDSAQAGKTAAFHFLVLDFGRKGDVIGGLGNSAVSGLTVGVLTMGLNQLHASSDFKAHCKRLGYEPSMLKARISLMSKGSDGPITVGFVEGLDVLAQMRPLPEADRDDPEKRLAEESRALGLAVWNMLIQKHSLVSREFLEAKRS